MNHKITILSLGFRVILTAFIAAQTAWALERFEPDDGKKIYGMGQFLPDPTLPVPFSVQRRALLYYDHVVPGFRGIKQKVNVMPILNSDYVSLSLDWNDLPRWINRVKAVRSEEAQWFVPLVGIGIEVADVDKVLNGDFDARLLKWGKVAKDFSDPIYIRPLWEINYGAGGAHGDVFIKYALMKNGKSATATPSSSDIALAQQSAKSVFARIVETMRQGAGGELLNVAWVWHVIGPSPTPYENWYPGSSYVDWVGVSIFAPGMMEKVILDFAKSKGKPVMIAESSPAIDCGLGVDDPAATSKFFAPYFNYIESNAVIKAFIYINWKWMEYKKEDGSIPWKWANGRMQDNPTVLSYFANKVKLSAYSIPKATVFRIGQRPYEGIGFTASYIRKGSGNVDILTVVSRDKLWELRLSDQVWVGAGRFSDLASSDPRKVNIQKIDGLYPWESKDASGNLIGITASWSRLDRGAITLVSKDRFWYLQASDYKSLYVGKYADEPPTSLWKSPDALLGNLYPWQGAGLTAGWMNPADGTLTVVSKDRYFKLRLSDNKWIEKNYFSTLPSSNPWKKLPKVDGLYPWEGHGITAAWIRTDLNTLTVVSRNRFWRVSLPNYTYLESGKYGDSDPTSLWRKAPFVYLYTPTGSKGAPALGLAGLESGEIPAAESDVAMAEFRPGDCYAFPNPAKKGVHPVLHVEFGKVDSVVLSVYDVSGKLVQELIPGSPIMTDDGKGPTYAYEQVWDVSNIASGIYLCVAEAKKEGFSPIRKIFKIAVVK